MRTSHYFSLLLLVLASATWADNFSGGDEVFIVMEYGSLDLTRLHQLEEELDVIAKQTNSGKLDGDEVAIDGSKATIYMKSVDANRLIEAIRPALKGHDFSRDAHISFSR